MSTSPTVSISGAQLAAELQELVHTLSDDLTKSARETNRSAREAELQFGLRAADEMRDKADAIELGACISGALSVASSTGQIYGAMNFQCSLEGSPQSQAEFASKTAELTAHNGRIQGMVSAATTLSSVGGSVDRVFEAAGTRSESRATAYQAQAKAEGRLADESQSDKQMAAKVDESVRQLSQEMSRTRHAELLAIFANR